jgi:hypothetical protein
MADDIDNRLIAAHLAAALIAKIPSNGLPAVEAVKLYNDVLAELGKAGQLTEPLLNSAAKPLNEFYESSNGDVWSLVQHPATGEEVVMHQPNANSGGVKSYINIDQFLKANPIGPQHTAFRQMIEKRPA